ncbi:CLUMA_CG019609, isoform A [Clunio marinus]|uniref:CLUMA_CG019609, isoform A n=1 Tax=Clunio marinus TaxID=568069 RepID=A0A1J1J3Z6_9DIPT|nr:CLUMA_CG019609, isoform A [Clunio marinus]
MKELLNFFSSRRYSAVSTNESDKSQKSHKSLKTKPSIKRGISVLDALFHERKSGERTRLPKCIFFFLTFGVLLICLGVFVAVFQPYDIIFKWKLLLTDDGEIFQMWERPPVDLYLRVYIFNITNHEEFMAGRDKKLNVEEVGPYVYRELMSHENVTFNSNGTLSTIPHHPLEWRGDLSEGHSEDDVLYLPNIALLSIAHVTAPKNYFLRLPVNLVIRNSNSQPIVKMTAKEFMMGYESPLTTLGNTLLPHWIHFDKVGLLDRMYDFTGDFETFFTGETDIRKSGLYDTVRGSTDLPHWTGEHCSNIQDASDGTKFKSFIKPNETLKFFRKSMCRPQRLVRTDSSVDTVQGLEAVKYQFEKNALDNGVHDEANKCFCRDGHCLAEGLSDVTDCYYGFPIALSYPHFLDADPILLENVTGSSPNRSVHESFFMLNPTSGLPLKLSVKFQINLVMSDVRTMAHVEKFSHLTIPMLWFEFALDTLPERLENRFGLYLNVLPIVEKAGMLSLFLLGALFAITAVSRVALKTSKSITSENSYKKFNRNLINNSVYNPCEVKLIELKSKKQMANNVTKINERTKPDDDDSCEEDSLNVITRSQYELEDDDAISDIEYNEINEEGESTSSSSEATDIERSNRSSIVEIDIPSDDCESALESTFLTQTTSQLLEVPSRNVRSSMLKIVESDDES